MDYKPGFESRLILLCLFMVCFFMPGFGSPQLPMCSELERLHRHGLGERRMATTKLRTLRRLSVEAPGEVDMCLQFANNQPGKKVEWDLEYSGDSGYLSMSTGTLACSSTRRSSFQMEITFSDFSPTVSHGMKPSFCGSYALSSFDLAKSALSLVAWPIFHS
jgi:hypothetical protein